MTPNKCKKILTQLAKANPNPSTELIYHSHFELLIAVMLSAQATDVSVNKATPALFKRANTPQGLIKLGEDTLKDYIKSIGLFNSKAKNIIKTCHLLIDQHNSQIPDNRPALEALPGVGRKTANVVLNVAFNQATMPVDTHIFRVANRTGLAQGKTPLAVEKQLLKNIPEELRNKAHHWLILHGRYTCVARHPKCSHCSIRSWCEYTDKSS